MEISPLEIGVGLLTYNRPEYFQQVLASVPRNKIGTLVVVNDGENSYVTPQYGVDHIILNKCQKGVAHSKNLLLKYLIDKGYKHLFIIEDDIIIKSEEVFNAYIQAARSTGIHHLCYEKIADNEKTLKFTLSQSDGVKLGFYHNPQGAFMYIHANLVTKLGYMDENFHNAFEHIDFVYNLINQNVMPPFWYFPDLLDSEKYLTDIEGSSVNSTITNKEKYKEKWELSANNFIKKWGKFTSNIQDEGIESLCRSLIHLQHNYAHKKILNKRHKLSVIIPYRDRQNALSKIIPCLHSFVSRQIEDYEIIVVEQANNKAFNKGLLNNIGFKQSSGDYVCFHDVDLLPEIADYSYPQDPTHMSVHCSQFNYINIPDKIMGGVILFRKEHFEQVNGYSNRYEGWGKEDDDLYERCEREGLSPYKHQFGRYFSVPHIHRLNDPLEVKYHEKNGDRLRAFLNSETSFKGYKEDGLNSITDHEIIDVSKDKTFTHLKITF